MDYEKKYKEALEKAREWYNKTEPYSYTCIVEYIFPELKESEDEEIRKELVNYFTEGREFLSLCSFGRDKILAWLENQSESISLPKFTFDDILALQCCMETVNKVQEDKYLYEKLNDLHSRVYDAYHFEKQEIKTLGKSALEAIKEEKVDNANKIEPFDKYEGLTDFERTLADICIGWIGEELGWKQYIKDNADVLLKNAIEKFNSVQDVPFEKKPAWSEEDEENLNNIIWLCNNCINGSETTWIPSQATKIKHLIETIKERCLAQQKPTEWSEDDEKMFTKTLYFLDAGFNNFKVTEGIAECKGWLQSLKQKKNWKPSDEQMEALNEAIGIVGMLTPRGSYLKSLSEQLKKL